MGLYDNPVMLRLGRAASKGKHAAVDNVRKAKAMLAIEKYLNEKKAAGEDCILYYQIADALHLELNDVSEILQANGGGSNGVTI